MNTFNTVFLAVKKYCGKQKKFSGPDCFKTIAREANISPDKLDSYLKYLQDTGLIKYSTDENYIHLTTFGSKQAKLTKE
jgi:predicted transcriptional regulator